MRLSDSALVSPDATCTSAPRGTSAYAAIAVGIATFMIGTAAVAADAPATVSEAQVGANTSAADTATSETATRGTAGTHDAAAASAANDAQTADAAHASGAKGKKHGGKDKQKSTATADEVVVEGKQPEQQQVCHKSQATGTRLRQTVCTSVAQQQANDKATEQQAQDYLRRMSQQGTLAGPPSSPYIQSGIP